MAGNRKHLPEDFGNLYARHDGNRSAIAAHYGVHRHTVIRWLAEWGAGKIETGKADSKTVRDIIRQSGDNPDEVEVIRVKGMRYDTPAGEHTYTSAEWKPSPIALVARTEGWKRPKIKKPRKGKTQLICVCGDQHAPEHDKQFHAKFLSWLTENQPDKIVILGDLLENADVSRWVDRDGQATAKESIDAAYGILRDYIEAAPNAEIVWICGNHDQRVESYAAGNASKLANLARAGETQPVLAIPHLLRLDELRIIYVADYPLGKVQIAPNLIVIHGKAVRRGAGATALANLEKRGYSVISGHTHRAGIVYKTTLDVDDSPSTHVGAETGTMKHIQPEVFDEAPDHQNAFASVVVWPDGQFNIEMAMYSAGNLRWRDQRY